MKTLTDITIILDRSGSMRSIDKETIDGFNTFLKEQKSVKAEARLTLVQFDHIYELCYEALDLREALPLTRETYVPRGMTALLDAIGKTIDLTKKRIKTQNQTKKSEKIIFVILTDGHENNSKIYNRNQIFKKISKLEKKHGWQFIFLGANQDAIEEASLIGIPKASAMTFRADGEGVISSLKYMGKNLIRVREKGSKFSFSEEQRKEQEEFKPSKN